jgi:glucuronoarabinoxylan endo-1,4-beta-xylanase
LKNQDKNDIPYMAAAQSRPLLKGNYPNPFNPTTTIRFELPGTAQVTLKIFNILGQEVATLVSDRLSAGSHSYEWSCSEGTASGMYVYRLEVGGHIETRRMILLK